MTGSAIAAVISVSTSCTANAIGVGGLPGILSMQPQSWGPYAIAMAAAVVIPFTLTLIIGKSKGIDKVAEQTGREQAMAEAAAQAKQISENEKKPVSLKAFLDGKTVPMNEVPDQVFASLALGNGIAIEPTSNVLKAPADGTVTVTMDESNHAVGLTLTNGVEVLLHIGLDTVNMKGDGFTPLVKMGDSVKAGQDLIRFDADKIRAAGHPLITMCVVTDDGGFGNIVYYPDKTVRAGADTVADIR